MSHWENPKSVKPLKTIIIITTESITDGEIMNESGSRVGMDMVENKVFALHCFLWKMSIVNHRRWLI